MGGGLRVGKGSCLVFSAQPWQNGNKIAKASKAGFGLSKNRN